ncbi:hypothetical protein IE077_002829 [Cardiosporidium cionae]|uniref:Uncharacterized protein n=1 Tax=Cardiosporidium cionae TaxID=476202 RepID=A0ABQ7J9U3_9APIC|nr:hypothetical protein IE077_002829 [Cardiosporidium cionae]|eukprot:KAF8820776.1 hypothetical protein IE077_002829 [Cardiosporidium cionae]
MHRISLPLTLFVLSSFNFANCDISHPNPPCPEWGEWTSCDSSCFRERHRAGCNDHFQIESCPKCTTTTTTIAPDCGEWSEWGTCDSQCFRERHKSHCAQHIETEKCPNCVPSTGDDCTEWSNSICDTTTCLQAKSRRCRDEYEKSVEKCPGCTVAAPATTPVEGASVAGTTAESTAEEGESGGGNATLTAGGIAGALLLLAGAGAGTYQYRKSSSSTASGDEAELVYQPDDEDAAAQDAAVFVEREAEVEVMADDWGKEVDI